MYSDTLWLKNDGSADVLSSFILQVSKESTSRLNKISFIIPRPIDNLQNLSNLAVDPQYFVNEEGRTSGETRIINKDRIIFDGFDCRVRHEHITKPHIYENTTKVDIDLRDDPLPSGANELFLLKFNLYGLIRKLPDISVFQFTYFCPEKCKGDTFPALSHNLRIVPVVPIYNPRILQGGFDILVYAPSSQEIRSVIGRYKHIEIDVDYTGKQLSRKRSGVLWHLRELIQSPDEDIVWDSNRGFNKRQVVEGTVETPVVYEDINQIKKSSRRNLIIGIIGAIAGTTAIILYIILLIFSKVPPSTPS